MPGLFHLGLALAVATTADTTAAAPHWEDWLENFGHDSYRYPKWVADQMQACRCEVQLGSPVSVSCVEGQEAVDWRQATSVSWCSARHFLLSHMPVFDLHFLPGAVSVEGSSMLDDNIAFALMALNASKLEPTPPAKVLFAYLLPYATYHESRSNWRPLFFAKYFALAAHATSSREVLDTLIGDGTRLMNWTAFQWKDFPGKSAGNTYELGPFASGTAPPVVSPTDFLAYGYGSCTAWAKFLASTLKALGVPAREVGSPCWNTGEFAGLATSNPNVSMCWQGGIPGAVAGGTYLNNHNWVEYWDNSAGAWHFVDVATSSDAETTWFCGQYDDGCECSSPAGKAMQDHEILAPTWSPMGDDPELNGGPVLDVGSGLRLSTGEGVSPMVWSPRLASPLGVPLKDVGLRVVNRTGFYRCRASPPDTSAPELVSPPVV
ncbi:unnamed protein product [Polarella glacialis]|uniref:Transglutaminase-like domain-containing protein n=1 Tax=Polarella glacialis TaxID=89957 RepID=A0A813K0T1_POLGL|nr:unnamed protein product [Polarella glacialis]